MTAPEIIRHADGSYSAHFPATRHVVGIVPSAIGLPTITVNAGERSPIGPLDLLDPDARWRFCSNLNGTADQVETELAALGEALRVADTRPVEPAPPDPAEVATLREEIERERQGRLDAEAEIKRLQRLQSLSSRIWSNPGLRAEGLTFFRGICAAEAKHDATPEPDRPTDGFYRVPHHVIADRYGPNGPSRHRDTIRDHLDKGADWGLLEREVRATTVERVHIDQDTGEISTRREPVKELYIRASGDLLDHLERLATFQRPAPANHGGKRTRCPRCGGSSRIVTVQCGACGEIIARRHDPEPPDGPPFGADPPMPHLDASEPIAASGGVSSAGAAGHLTLMRQVAASSDDAWGSGAGGTPGADRWTRKSWMIESDDTRHREMVNDDSLPTMRWDLAVERGRGIPAPS